VTQGVKELASLPVDALSRFRPLLRYAAQHRAALIALLVAASFFPMALLLREQIERRAFAVALHSMAVLGVLVKEPKAPPPDEEEFLPLLSPFGEASPAQPDQPGASAHALHRNRRTDPRLRADQKWMAPPILPPPVNHHASEERVLSWASTRVMPQGRTREAGFGLPAGIELSSVAGLGIGLLDGDRLVAVGGVPVSERAQVISLVLAARGRHEPQLVATLFRRTTLGPRSFSVVVDQPYPTGLVENGTTEPVSSAAPGISSSRTQSASPD